MKISVIIPLFNAEKYLPVCLESLAIQTFADFEVIVVDDCSTDNSLAVAENFLERFGGRLKIVMLPENTGNPAVPRNVGLDLSCGEYVFFVDDDDLLIDTALETLYNFAQDYRADVIYMDKFFSCDEEPVPKELNVAAWGHLDYLVEEPTFETEDFSARVQMFLKASFGWAPWEKFLRRDFLIANDIKFPRVTVFEDMAWTFKLLCTAKNFLRISEPLYICREVKNSVFRRERSSEQRIIFQTNPLINGLEYLDEFMRGLEYFRQNPADRLQVLNAFANTQFLYMKDAFRSLPPEKVYEIFWRELSKAGSTHSALIALLLVMNNIYRNELIK